MTLHCSAIGIFGDSDANFFPRYLGILVWIGSANFSMVMSLSVFCGSSIMNYPLISDFAGGCPLHRPHDAASASKSAAALAASKESAVPFAMTFHSFRSPVFLLISKSAHHRP